MRIEVYEIGKPRNFGLWFFVLGLIMIMFYLNLDNYLVFFLLLSTWTWDTFLTLRGTLPFLNLTLDWDLALGLSILHSGQYSG